MESPQNIKKRLRSVNNISKITKAMEMVAATKMRKSQEIALASRPYAFAALDFLATLSSLEKVKLPALFETRKIKTVLFVVVSSDKGLAGAFNSSVFRKFENHLKSEKEEWKKEKHVYVAVGEKAFNYLTKKGFNVVKKFNSIGDHTTPEQIRPIADFIVQGFLQGNDEKNGLPKQSFEEKAGLPSRSLGEGWDRVVVVSTHFRSALKQEPHVRRVLPIDFDHIKETIQEIIPERGKFADLIKENNISFVPDATTLKEYLIEPSAKEVLESLASHLFFVQIYSLILEANASEHSARRMAMKAASDNANDLSEKYNLQYNKSRQSRITTEISEISAGAEALN